MHNTERVKELSCNHAENKDTINEKKQCRLRWIVRCARKTNTQDALRQRNTGKVLREEVVMEKLVGTWQGKRVGRPEHHALQLL